MSKQEIRNAALNAEPYEVLRQLVSNGFEYPDAEWRVISSLSLTRQEQQELREAYDCMPI